MNNFRLNDDDIGVLLANWYESEDELKNSDGEIPVNGNDECAVDNNDINYNLNIENMTVEIDNEQGDQYIIYPESEPIPTPLPVRPTPRPINLKNMKWKKGSLTFNENTRPHTFV